MKLGRIMCQQRWGSLGGGADAFGRRAVWAGRVNPVFNVKPSRSILMKRQVSLLPMWWCALGLAWAAPVPPPDQLLPRDTLAMVTVTDAARARRTYGQWATVRLWQDPAMKPFRDKFINKLKAELWEPLERELGIKLADYAGLAQGQVTLALTSLQPGAGAGFVLVVDARDKADTLKSTLAELKRKWTESGKTLTTDTLQGREFTTLVFSPADIERVLSKALPDLVPARQEGEESQRKLRVTFGLSDSLLVLGNEPKDIERVLQRQTGGGVPSLAEQPGFAASAPSLFREALTYGWVNLKALIQAGLQRLPKPDEDAQEPGGPALPRPDKLLGALGLTGLESLSFSIRDDAEGSLATLQIGMPESARTGLLKLLALPAKEAGPPPFVPADVVEFSRVRLDLYQAWQTLEKTLTEAVPQMGGVLKLLIDNAGKDKDPEFDLRKHLLANLGDDIISFQKPPREHTLQALESRPGLLLISSPKPEQLAGAVRALTSMLPGRGAKVKERQFLGRTVYSLSFALPSLDGKAPTERTLNYAASGGYVAFSYDLATLEEYLRHSGTAPKALADMPGLAQAAQKVGGMNTGLFGYENQRESMRATIETLRKESGSLAHLFGGSPWAGRWAFADQKKLQAWLDFSLLPPFDAIAKYFHIAVFSAATTPQGILVRAFTPQPPELRR